jgi:hypothetical protein
MQDHAQTFLLWSFRLVLVAAAIAVFCFIMASVVASAAECKSEQSGKGYWSWRYIKPHDHKRCWYPGHRILPKSRLHWPEIKPEKKLIDPVFPPPRAQIKTVAPDEFNELDAQAGNDFFFDAKPLTLWPPIIFPLMPFVPWQERIAGTLN